MTTHAIDEQASGHQFQGQAIKTLLILGASGDLTGRLLLPGLARLVRHGKAKGITLVGAGSDAWSAEDWQERLATSFAAATPDSGTRNDDGALEQICAASTYHQVDVTAKGSLAGLIAGLQPPVAIYFALPPAVSEKACATLEPEDLPEGSRLVMEKPFGTDRESATRLNTILGRLVPEDHIHRVDHFLGKATVLNILGLRFANRLLEPVWNSLHIDSVDIIFDEKLTLENRARYYDGAGALKDMIQSHLLQVMAVIAMNAPSTLHERDLRDHIGTVLRASSVHPDFRSSTRRARYTAGTIDAREVPNYVDESGVDPSRGTETLAEIVVSINNERWAGVPFRLRSGKSLGRIRKEAVITFKPVNHLPDGFTGVDSPTRLRIGFGPDTLELDLDVNGPGDVFCLDRATLQAELNASELLPYGEVLDGVLSGDPTLSVRGDTAEDCWRIVEPVLEAWKANDVPMDEYSAGSAGPSNW
ncbi:glucose-6-phosphate dehydrogenase [Arthrobacter tumbae]|uniref:glucose-6-phosphate dehydrogenase n=1 Tax=Arthrobacter tumbae TaxID=163874 RepID=UPI0027DAB78D|nr:glucose-6-phosphate dehydrogenase [Arthrobacter tumbae]MBM7779861.1 glucose-6-phosphate 1-dehydrogenase [Arthrobacter tumbae]